MKKLNCKKLRLSTDTLLVLDGRLEAAAGGATLICNSIAHSCTVTLCGHTCPTGCQTCVC